MKNNRKTERRFRSKRFKVAPQTALQSSIIVLSRQSLGRRLQVCWAILTKRYANAKVQKG